MTELTFLGLSHNEFSGDISPLANLTKLSGELSLDGNQISDISTLANLTELTQLLLDENEITDLSALANLTKLTSLFLAVNALSAEAIATQIPDLEARGVTVTR